MRHSQFWEFMSDEFGQNYARSLALDLNLGALNGRTPQQALDDGDDPRVIWEAICVVQNVPEERRFGKPRTKRV